MSAKDIKPENLRQWLNYARRKREQAIAIGSALGRCEHGHYDCSPIWNGTCVEEVLATSGAILQGRIPFP
jgi:hypothetical protein